MRDPVARASASIRRVSLRCSSSARSAAQSDSSMPPSAASSEWALHAWPTMHRSVVRCPVPAPAATRRHNRGTNRHPRSRCQADIDASRAAGFDQHLGKPVSPEALEAALAVRGATGQHDGSRRGSKPAGSKPEGSKQCRWSELRQNRLVTSRLWARRPRPAGVPPIEHDPAILASFLSDAAHVPGGSSPGIVFPHDEAEVAAIVAASDRVLAIGAQSSLTGGATPRGEVLVSTRALSAIGVPADGCVHVGAGVPLAVLQQALTASGLY